MTKGSGDPVAYLDANVFIYFFDGNPERAEAAKSILFGINARAGTFATSELTLAEVLAPSQRRRPGQERREFLDLIALNPAVRLYPVTRDVLLETAELRQSTRFKLPDAIHCATATRVGCKFLVSGDRGMSRLPQSLVWLDVTLESATTLARHIDV